MTVYSVYEPSTEAADLVARAERLAFVKDGFSLIAFLVPALWLIFYRMWLELIVFLVGFAALEWMFGTSDPGKTLFGWVSLGLFVLFAFEANDLRAASLERRGYRLVGVASGRDRGQAELSFFRTWLPEQEKQARAQERTSEKPGSGSSQSGTRGEPEEVIGLFPGP